MATLSVTGSVINVGGGTYTVELVVKDASGAVVDSAESAQVIVPEGEVIQLDVTTPIVMVRLPGTRTGVK